jgi:hypothetical protein
VVLNVVLGWLSLKKQRFYCNGNKYVFCKSAKALADMPDPGPRIECRCEIIRDFAGLERQACCPEIRKEIVKFAYYLRQGCQIYLIFHQNAVVAHSVVASLKRFHPYPFADHAVFEGGTDYLVFFGRTFPAYLRLRVYTAYFTVVQTGKSKQRQLSYLR